MAIRGLLVEAGIAVAHLPNPDVRQGAARRIDIVEDHQDIAVSMAALRYTPSDPDPAILDLRLSDGSTPEVNMELPHNLEIHRLVYTAGDRRDLIRAAARACVLGVALKSDSVEHTISMIRTTASGKQITTTSWASAISSTYFGRYIGNQSATSWNVASDQV
jgi:DNA-binding NarL/FixJ family response regulator